jgi:hypothetical protein
MEIKIGNSVLTESSYLLDLNARKNNGQDDGTIWLPRIDSEAIKRISTNGNRIVIAHDWFSQGCYEYGAFAVIQNKIIELQKHPHTKIINTNEDYIFEEGSSDHKGFIAIELEKVPELFFVMNTYWGDDSDSSEITIWFESNVSKEDIFKVLNLIQIEAVKSVEIIRDQITITAKDYEQMILELPVKLI